MTSQIILRFWISVEISLSRKVYFHCVKWMLDFWNLAKWFCWLWSMKGSKGRTKFSFFLESFWTKYSGLILEGLKFQRLKKTEVNSINLTPSSVNDIHEWLCLSLIVSPLFSFLDILWRTVNWKQNIRA